MNRRSLNRSIAQINKQGLHRESADGLALLRVLLVLPLFLLSGALAGCGQGPGPDPATPTPPATATVAVLLPSPAPSATRPAPTATVDAARVVALVNGEPIPRDAWARQVARALGSLQQEGQTGAQADEVAERVLDEMIDERLLRQAAVEMDIAISNGQLDEVLAREEEMLGGRAAFQGWLQENGLARAEYRAATELQLLTSALRERITSDLSGMQPQVHLRHILLPTREAADVALAELATGTPWEEVVAARSVDPGTRASGGDLGWMPRGVLPPALDDAVWELSPGERSPILESEFGFHIIEMIEQDPERPLPLELLQALQQQAWEQWLAQQRAAATIEIIE